MLKNAQNGGTQQQNQANAQPSPNGQGQQQQSANANSQPNQQGQGQPNPSKPTRSKRTTKAHNLPHKANLIH